MPRGSAEHRAGVRTALGAGRRRSTSRAPRTATIDQLEDGITTRGTSASVLLGHSSEDGISHKLDADELGLKDTFRVNPNEVVDVVVLFEVV